MSDVLIPDWAYAGGPSLANLDGETHNGLPLNSNSVALESSRIVKSGAGTLYGFTVYNNKATAQFIQVFDLGQLPSNGVAPVWVTSVPATTVQGINWVYPGRYFRAGCVIANSSTAATLTIGSADCWFDAQYV